MRGGLSYAVVLVGAVLGAITGTVAASVIAMGLISLPIMLRYGYNTRHATCVIAASGTITQLIPPSLVLIVLADQLGKSVGDMYAGVLRPKARNLAAMLSELPGSPSDWMTRQTSAGRRLRASGRAYRRQTESSRPTKPPTLAYVFTGIIPLPRGFESVGSAG